jgi:Tfp pilus assembly protein PilN
MSTVCTYLPTQYEAQRETMPTRNDAGHPKEKGAEFLLGQLRLAHEKIRILETHLLVADAERHKAESQVDQLLNSREIMIKAFKGGDLREVQQAISATSQMLENIYENLPESEYFKEDQN